MSETDDEVAAIVRKFAYAEMELDGSAVLEAFKMLGALEARTQARIAAANANVRSAWRTAYRVAWFALTIDAGFVLLNGFAAALNSAQHEYKLAAISLASATLSAACGAWMVRMIDALNRSAKWPPE